MSEIKLDVVVETVEALAQMDAFASSAESLFKGVESSAQDAGSSVDQLSARIADIPQSTGTLVFAEDNATPTLESIRQAVESIPSEKWVTIRTRYETRYAAQSGVVPDEEGSFAVGVERVPRDMLAMIHKNEAVLAPEEARAYRELKESGNSLSDGANPIHIQNLTIANFSSLSSGAKSREQLRKKLAPELTRYMRRSGRFGMINRRGVR